VKKKTFREEKGRDKKKKERGKMMKGRGKMKDLTREVSMTKYLHEKEI
jgi:hypothetical protein